jgi:hypothetical protein
MAFPLTAASAWWRGINGNTVATSKNPKARNWILLNLFTAFLLSVREYFAYRAKFVSRNKTNDSKGMQCGRYGDGPVYLTIGQIFCYHRIKAQIEGLDQFIVSLNES